MVMLDFERIRRAATAMSDEELADALGARRDDYVPEALEVLSSELERRGISPRDQVPAKQNEKAILPWLTAYVSLSGIGAFSAMVSTARTSFDLSSLATSGFLLAVAYYLNKRAGWAWWANWLLLALSTARLATLGSIVIAALWGIGNGVYFYRARQHFTA